MAKATIRENGKTYRIELDGKYTPKEQEILERLGIIEKPKKKKYKNVKQEKDASKDSGETSKGVQQPTEERTDENK